MPSAVLADRGAVRIAGEDASAFLNGLVTIAMATVTKGQARYGALLTPQGKILVDFIAVATEDGDGFLLDCPKALAPDLARRLALYKLRAKVEIADLSGRLGVAAFWGDAPPGEGGRVFADPRLPELGVRSIADSESVTRLAAGAGATDGPAAYDAHRIVLGVPQGGRDFVYGETFPHEADLDQLNGVDFDKGCYVGQEVVSRMEHRSLARTRIVPVIYAQGDTPPEGTEILAGGRMIGRAGSGAGGRGLAMLRLDRLREAVAAGEAVTAGGLALRAERPNFARFDVPGEGA